MIAVQRWLALAAMLCVAAGPAQASPKVGEALSLPAVTLLDGQQRPAAFYQGKPVIVEYWASWCPFCARQNPNLQVLWEQARQRGLEVLAISIDSQEEDARQYLAQKQYTFPAAMQNEALMAVFGKPRVIPVIYVVTAQGQLAEVIPGEMFEEDVLDLIKYAPAPDKVE